MTPEQRLERLERLLSRVRSYRVMDERFERQYGLELDIDDALAGRPERLALHQVSWCCRCMQRLHRCSCERGALTADGSTPGAGRTTATERR